jgi:hypothetical protein
MSLKQLLLVALVTALSAPVIADPVDCSVNELTCCKDNEGAECFRVVVGAKVMGKCTFTLGGSQHSSNEHGEDW